MLQYQSDTDTIYAILGTPRLSVTSSYFELSAHCQYKDNGPTKQMGEISKQSKRKHNNEQVKYKHKIILHYLTSYFIHHHASIHKSKYNKHHNTSSHPSLASYTTSQ